MKRYFTALIEKYSNLSIPVKASLWFMVCNLVQKGISMITIPLFTRLLTTEEYGLFSVYQSWYMIIGIFACLNLQDAAYNTGMIKYSTDKDNFTLSLQNLTTTLTAVLFVIYIINPKFWNGVFELPSVLILTMFIELLFIPGYSFWSARQKFEYKYAALIVTTLFIAIMCPTVAVIAIKLSPNKGVARIVSFTLVQSFVGVIFYIRTIKKGSKIFNFEYWKYGLKFSIPLIPHYLSMQVLQQSDRIMIGRLVGNGEAAIYSIAYNISQLVMLLCSAINNSFIPYTYRCIKTANYKDLKKNSKLLLVVVASAMIVLMLVGPEVVKIFATADYYDAIWIIPPVSTSVFFIFLYPMFSNVEFYFEKSKVAMLASIIGAVLNLVLNYMFIPIFGYIAAGYTTLFCYVIFAIMHYLGMKRVLSGQGIDEDFYDIEFIIALSMVMFAVMIGVLFIYKHTLIRYVVILIIFIIGIVCRNKVISLLKGLKK